MPLQNIVGSTREVYRVFAVKNRVAPRHSRSSMSKGSNIRSRWR